MKNIFNFSASQVTLKRLAGYFCRLSQLPGEKVPEISSSQLAKMMDTNSSQLRQDFHHFGGFGKPGHPYDINILKEEFQKIFGVEDTVSIILVGATAIARTLIENTTLPLLNISIVGVIDDNPDLSGSEFGGVAVHSSRKLGELISQHDIKVGAVCTQEPEKPMQLLIENGIKAIWNLTPIYVRQPEGVSVRHENLAAGLMTLLYKVNQ